MCSHLRSREIRTRARSSSLTRKIGRQCRLIGDDMTERYQTNRRQNFHFEAPRLNIDPSVIFVGLMTSLHLLVILSRNGWHFLWRYWREKKRSEWISNYYIYKIASERKYQAMKQTFDNELIPFLYSPKQGFITYLKTYCSSINSII